MPRVRGVMRCGTESESECDCTPTSRLRILDRILIIISRLETPWETSTIIHKEDYAGQHGYVEGDFAMSGYGE